MSDRLDPIPPTRRLGTSGLEVGSIAYGCWRLTEGDRTAATTKIAAALDAGMTLIDTADIYGYLGGALDDTGHDGFGDAEALLGEVLRADRGLRDRMVLATKGGIRPPLPYDQSPDHLRGACEASLRRLGVEVIDLYQIHRPDLLASPAEVAAVLDELVDEGKVRTVGVSNHTVGQHRALGSHLRAPIVTSQPEWHPLCSAPLLDGTLDLCQELGVTPLVWSPLAGGRLLGEVDGLDPAAARVATVVDRIAAERDVDRAAVLLAWVAHHPSGAIPIVGTQQPERIRRATDAFSVHLRRSEWYEILVAGRGEPMP